MGYVCIFLEEELVKELRDVIERLLGEKCELGTLNVPKNCYDVEEIMEKLQNDELVVEVDITEITVKLLHEIGIPNNLKGYKYLIDAVNCYFEKAEVHPCISKLYIEVAKLNDSTPTRVERAIRNAIEVMFNNHGSKELIKDIFQYAIPKDRQKLTNSQFFSLLVEKLKMDYNL